MRHCKRCRHTQNEHQHYRSGTECSHADIGVLTGAVKRCTCPRFKRWRFWS